MSVEPVLYLARLERTEDIEAHADEILEHATATMDRHAFTARRVRTSPVRWEDVPVAIEGHVQRNFRAETREMSLWELGNADLLDILKKSERLREAG